MIIKNTAFNYDEGGQVYSVHRETDPRIAKFINDSLGNAKTVLNIGAGTGSYEPDDKYVIAVEPSSVMRSQRGPEKVPAIIADAMQLPFDDNSFDASMAMVTIHHWPNIKKGLLEMKRVTKKRVLIFTFDPNNVHRFWLADYAPEMVEIDKARFPKVNFITKTLGGNCEVKHIPVPVDCTDGFNEAFYARPEAFLNEGVRRSQSFWDFLPGDAEKSIINKLRNDIVSGEWDKRYGYLRNTSEFSGALRLVIAKL